MFKYTWLFCGESWTYITYASTDSSLTFRSCTSPSIHGNLVLGAEVEHEPSDKLSEFNFRLGISFVQQLPIAFLERATNYFKSQQSATAEGAEKSKANNRCEQHQAQDLEGLALQAVCSRWFFYCT